jgi:hypothetical protein
MSANGEKDKYYKQILKICLLLTLFIFTLLFYFFPRIEKMIKKSNSTFQVEIYVSDIPQTLQQVKSTPPPPAKPYGSIPIPAETMDLPEEISLSKLPGKELSDDIPIGIMPEIPPKPLFEVYPSISGVTCKGQVSLLLLVNKSGITENVEVLENSTLQDTCLKVAIEAAQKSRWIPAKVNEEPVSSWITKTYKFDINK